MPQTIPVPDYVQQAAKRGLDWHAEGKSGDGVTDQTIREARDMVEGLISEDKVRRMGPWFRRHRPDMDAPKNKPDNKDFPGAGAVAWALWGGPTSGDIMRAAEWAERKVEQLDKESAASPQPERLIYTYMTIEGKLAAAEALVASLTAERDDLRKSVEASTVGVSAELEALKVDVAAKDASIVQLTESLAAAQAEIAALKASAQSASKEAATILASSGVEPVKAESSPAAAAASIAEQYAAMPAGPERRAFFKKHKCVLFSK